MVELEELFLNKRVDLIDIKTIIEAINVSDYHSIEIIIKLIYNIHYITI